MFRGKSLLKNKQLWMNEKEKAHIFSGLSHSGIDVGVTQGRQKVKCGAGWMLRWRRSSCGV